MLYSGNKKKVPYSWLDPNSNSDPWKEKPFDESFEKGKSAEGLDVEQNKKTDKSLEVEEKEINQETIANSKEIEKKSEAIKGLKKKQNKTRTDLKSGLEGLASRCYLSASLLENGNSFNGVTTQEREQFYKDFEVEEKEISDKGDLTESDNNRLEELNQKRIELILEQTFADTLNLNGILAKILAKINSLSESDQQNSNQIDFQELSGELSNFLNEFNQVTETHKFYRDDNKKFLSFKRVLCDEYDMSMNLNKNVDRRTNYDQFLDQEVKNVEEKIQILEENFNKNPEEKKNQSEKQRESDSAENLSRSVRDSFVGKNNDDDKDKSKTKNNDDEFDAFMKNGVADEIDTMGKKIEKEGEKFF
jgi:hypothetical protein